MPWIGIITACLLAGLLLTFGKIERHQNSDSFMPTLVGMLHWTPYFWRQNYFGMLLPTLAWPFGSPWAKLVFINTCNFSAGVGAHFALAYALRRAPDMVWVGALSVACQFLAVHDRWLFDNFASGSFYVLPLVLGILGMRACSSTKHWLWLVALGLWIAMSWYNIGIVLLLLVLITKPPWSSTTVRQIALVCLAELCGYIIMRMQPFDSLNGTLLPLTRWPEAIIKTAADLLETLGRYGQRAPWILFIMPLAIGVSAMLTWWFPQARHAWREYRCTLAWITAGSCAYAWFVCVQSWAAANAFNCRYWFPALLLMQVNCLTLLVSSLHTVLEGFSRLTLRPYWSTPWVQLGIMLLAVISVSGLPTTANLRLSLESKAELWSEQALATKARFIAGNYWHVWPAVFFANAFAYEQANLQPIWGVTSRSEQLLARLPSLVSTDVRIFVPKGDESEAAGWCARFGFPPLQLGETTADGHLWMIHQGGK